MIYLLFAKINNTMKARYHTCNYLQYPNSNFSSIDMFDDPAFLILLHCTTTEVYQHSTANTNCPNDVGTLEIKALCSPSRPYVWYINQTLLTNKTCHCLLY